MSKEKLRATRLYCAVRELWGKEELDYFFIGKDLNLVKYNVKRDNDRMLNFGKLAPATRIVSIDIIEKETIEVIGEK